MLNKLYETFKKNILLIDIVLITCFVGLFPVPYYIIGSDGVSNTKEKVFVDGAYKAEGSFNISFIMQKEANIASIIKAWIDKDEDIEKQENSKDKKENNYYGSLDLEQAKDDAIIVAYSHALKEVKIKEKHFLITYIDEKSKTNLELQDEIISIENNKINELKEISEIVNQYEVGKTLQIKVKNKDKEILKQATTYYGEDERLIMGVALVEDKEYTTNPKIEVNFLKEESGPSGGLMLALEIYNQLTSKDYTNGLKIAGTGTIDISGKVGAVGGIKYKLKGAIDANCDIFLVPYDINYEEAIQLQKQNNYDIKIIAINTFDEAIDYLSNL